MLEFYSHPRVTDEIEARYRKIFHRIGALLWCAMPENAERCHFAGKSTAEQYEYETRFNDKYGRVYVDWVQAGMCEQVMLFVAELRHYAPFDNEGGKKGQFRATVCEGGNLKMEFACMPQTDGGSEIFMCRFTQKQKREKDDKQEASEETALVSAAR